MNNLWKAILAIPLFYLSGCASTFEYVDRGPLHHQWCDRGTKKKIRTFIRTSSYANNAFVYAIASHKVYADPNKEDIHFPKSESWIGICESGGSCERNVVEDKSLGFAAQSWIRSTDKGVNELVIAFRGTQFSSMNDWFRANLVFFPKPLAFWSDQYTRSRRYTENIIKSADLTGIEFKNIVFTGHSLGGGLAMFSQRKYSPKTARAIVFDPSPNRARLKYSLNHLFTEVEDLNAVRIYEKWEILTGFRYLLDNDILSDEGFWGFDRNFYSKDDKNDMWINVKRGNIFAQHSMLELASALIKIAALADNKDAIQVALDHKIPVDCE